MRVSSELGLASRNRSSPDGRQRDSSMHDAGRLLVLSLAVMLLVRRERAGEAAPAR